MPRPRVAPLSLTVGARRRFALQRMRFIFSVCVSPGDIKRHRSRFSSHLILRKLSRPVMNHFIFFSGWWRQAFPSQTHCVPLLKGPQTVIQNIRYYIFPSAGKIITGPSVALFAREPCTRAPRPLCCFYFLLKTICDVRKRKKGSHVLMTECCWCRENERQFPKATDG